MPIEIANWLEIPVTRFERAKTFYEFVFQTKLVAMDISGEFYHCFPNKNGEGFSAALVLYDFIKPGKTGALVYLNCYGDLNGMLERIKSSGGKIIQERQEIAPGMGYMALFEDPEGNLFGLQDEK